ncbi:Tyrosine recombinase XerC [termite gut metagenome]|uniref:Tyrosine recombinase XerC n=1 Tax=termite gut metagenome TaxID=433724 RepID=A0A5J4Q8X5_9ZZZZ
MQTNRSTFNILFYLNTSKTKKSGKCPILGRISVDGKSSAFSTGLDIELEHWDAKMGMARGKSKDIISLNKQIENYKSELGRHYRNMVENQGYVTAESLKNTLRGIGINQNTVIQEFASLVEEKKKSIGISIEASTYPIYPNALKHFRDFLQEKYNVDDIPFGKVDIALIDAYAYYLKIDLRMTPRTVKTNMIPFRTTVKRAFNKGMIRQDPFFEYTPEKSIPKRPWLSNEEIERLMNVKMKHSTWNFTRDMFIFSTFTGIAFIDLENLKHSNIQKQEDGSLWIVLNRQKTGTASYIPLLPIAQRILERYKNSEFTGGNGKVFKLQHHVNVNWQLKRLAKAAGIDKRLTFHMSRFTFATTICLTGGVPIETLSQMMGHLSIRTTQIYAEVTRTKINEDMNNLAKHIEGKYDFSDVAPIKRRVKKIKFDNINK